MADTSAVRVFRRPIVVAKAHVEAVTECDTEWTRLIYTYLACSAVWLVLGTLIGLYLAAKMVWPDVDHVPWLSFGRLRPVHTNTVFWGWTSLAMIALTLYVVPKTSQRRLYSFPLAGDPVVTAEDPTVHIRTVLHGLQGKAIDGVRYASPMPAFASLLSDDEIAAVINHERSSWGNNAPTVTAGEVAKLRKP